MSRRKGFRAALVAVFAIAAAPASAQSMESPATLEDCYLNVAMHKSTPDMVYLAREICDAVFDRRPRALTVLDPRTKDCDEWWFDANGRSESAERYCALAASGPGTWKLACRWKSSQPDTYSFVELRQESGRFTPVGAARGRPLGAIFDNLTACVEEKLGGTGGGAPNPSGG